MMWPFKKRAPERDATGEAIAKLKAFREVGETFNYLGRTCLVTGHWDYYPHIRTFVPVLKFDYCDDAGVLHSARAYPGELPALMNQQKPGAVPEIHRQ